MQNRVVAVSICFLFILASWLIEPTSAAAKSDLDQDKFVLAVGINKYQSPDIPVLDGCENDVDDITALLTKTFGFPGDATHIRTLKTAQATKTKILEAFQEQLLDNAKSHPKGTFVFYYSGHGSQIADTGKIDEADGLDEALVPYDATSDEKTLIIDDDLNTFIKKLTDSASNVRLFFDCCAPGTNTRDVSVMPPDVKARYLNWEKLTSKPLIPTATDGGVNVEDEQFVAPGTKYFAISGCQPDERSQEANYFSEGIPRRSGALTHHMKRILIATNGNLSYRDLGNELFKSVSGQFSRQHPSLEGDLDRKFLSQSKERTTPYYPVRAKSIEGDTLIAEVGEIMGLKEGGIVALYKSNTFQLKGAEGLLTTAEVTSVSPGSCKVKLVSPVSDISMLEKAKVVVVTPETGMSQLNIALKTNPSNPSFGSEHKDFLSSLKATLEAVQITKKIESLDNPLRQSPRSWNLAVVSDSYKNFVGDEERLKSIVESKSKSASEAKAIDPSEQVYLIATEDGDPLYSFCVPVSDGSAAEQIADVLSLRAHERQVYALANKASNGAFKIDCELTRKDNSGTSVRKFVSPLKSNEFIDEIGDGGSLNIKVKSASKTKFFFGILCVASKWRDQSHLSRRWENRVNAAWKRNFRSV